MSAQGESVSLGRNEATLVRSGAPPSAKIDILPAPALAAPQDDQVAFDAAVAMSWAGVADAAGYWLEVAYDPGFGRMTFSRWGLAQASFESAPLEVGSYYWRVAALDKFGLPGERSEVWRFHVRTDVTPPYLSIGEPAEGGILRQSPLDAARRERAGRHPRARRPAARGRPRRPLRGPLPAQARAQPADRQGDRCRRQRHRTVARLRLHAGRARRGDLRRRAAAARRPPLRDRARRDVDHRPHQRQRADPDPLGRRRRARLRLRRRRRAVRGQRAAAGGERGVRHAGHRALGLRERGPLRDHASTRPRRGSSSRRRRLRSPRSNGCRSGVGSRAASSSWSTASRRS